MVKFTCLIAINGGRNGQIVGVGQLRILLDLQFVLFQQQIDQFLIQLLNSGVEMFGNHLIMCNNIEVIN